MQFPPLVSALALLMLSQVGVIERVETADIERNVSVGLVPPYSTFHNRGYQARVSLTLQSRGSNILRSTRFVHRQMFKTLSPTAILNALCNQFLPANVAAIIYINNKEHYGRNTASSQYFLQLARYLGIPVIAWNADNSGLDQEQGTKQSSLRLELAPSIHHQAAAMLSILQRYNWHGFAIVTSQIAGYDEFTRAVRDTALELQEEFKFSILNTIIVRESKDLEELANSEARIMLLYCTKDEAREIMHKAHSLHITGKNYVWIVTQSVIGSDLETVAADFPIGMLGLHFETSSMEVMKQIGRALEVFIRGAELFFKAYNHSKLSPQLSCEGHGEVRWDHGELFYRHLLNVSFRLDEVPDYLAFNSDGTVKSAQLKIMNLRRGNSAKQWEEIGTWRADQADQLNIKDIVWPGLSHVPPEGVPEKFHLKILFLEESPYVILGMPDPITGKCSANRGVLCRIAPEADIEGMNLTVAQRNSSLYQCCSGFCIDLLEKFAKDLIFTYDLVRVDDGKWGTIENGSWTGLVSALMNRKGDMVITSFNINSDRESVIDFSVPFLETGTTILVAKRTGIISPTAFLEPFDTASWTLVAFVAIHATALTIFLFEWLSPSGYNMKTVAPRDHKFSLFRTYWLVWAILFQAAVHTDCPRGLTARFMASMWALFAVVFLAIYTANLAAFMITREEFHELKGIDDERMRSPYQFEPPFRAGTVLHTNTEMVLREHKPQQFRYILRYPVHNVQEGVKMIKTGELDAFLYDATVLQYMVAQDDDCEILTVGAWYGMTGYGVGFRRGSKYLDQFNEKLMQYKDNGYIERLQRFWLTGACKPQKQHKRASEPLALEQFLSAFLLLGCGILLACAILACEHCYFKHIRKQLAKTDRGGCCALISLNMGKSLTFRGAVYEAQDIIKYHRCRDPICDTHLLKVKRELDVARLRIRELEHQLGDPGLAPSARFLASVRRDQRAPVARRPEWGLPSAVRHHMYTQQSAEFIRPHPDSYAAHRVQQRPASVEIAELETVL
ncbi:glutamate receptor ionotropic, NMDA 2B-like isoform X2 [Amphibalanus amphitrite]|uniref:glutamate receptor ionotropic, NMDA 2B-like isoform X2 n=1 Tax=Amphibalanus amphitrite TaxID=1232801 RepID=UPI001C91ECD5|nr:glutamate receptor ionotropic, NMDA 2B-like isoform X2 [Amphibalanus amphitrite]XP_043223941.1 glutamate receptor ionotropic, NMDA 2B-like isoform X2 [Amphibalanus amphitrite]